ILLNLFWSKIIEHGMTAEISFRDCHCDVFLSFCVVGGTSVKLAGVIPKGTDCRQALSSHRGRWFPSTPPAFPQSRAAMRQSYIASSSCRLAVPVYSYEPHC